MKIWLSYKESDFMYKSFYKCIVYLNNILQHYVICIRTRFISPLWEDFDTESGLSDLSSELTFETEALGPLSLFSFLHTEKEVRKHLHWQYNHRRLHNLRLNLKLWDQTLPNINVLCINCRVVFIRISWLKLFLWLS